jgi:mitogen-activated protein kinase organizer 1
VSGSFDASVRVWDTKATTQKPVQILSDAKDSISCVMVNSGGHEIVAGSVDGRVRYYDIRMGKMDTDVLGAPVTSLASMKDGEAVLVGTLDGRIRLVDRRNGGCLMTYGGHKNVEFRIRSCFGGKERWVLCGSEGTGGVLNTRDGGGEVVVWDTLSGEMLERVSVEGPGEQGVSVRKRVHGKGERYNVISCVAWKNDGNGDQWCCAGTDGVVTVFGQ